MGVIRGRFAPSPSGRMHLGNLFSALLAWLSVRSAGGVMVLRMEDLDPDRCRREYAGQLAGDLRWLGLDWDEGYEAGGPHGPYPAKRADRIICRCLSEPGGAGPDLPLLLHPAQRLAASAPHRGDGQETGCRCKYLTETERAALARTRRPAGG